MITTFQQEHPAMNKHTYMYTSVHRQIHSHGTLQAFLKRSICRRFAWPWSVGAPLMLLSHRIRSRGRKGGRTKREREREKQRERGHNQRYYPSLPRKWQLHTPDACGCHGDHSLYHAPTCTCTCTVQPPDLTTRNGTCHWIHQHPQCQLIQGKQSSLV